MNIGDSVLSDLKLSIKLEVQKALIISASFGHIFFFTVQYKTKHLKGNITSLYYYIHYILLYLKRFFLLMSVSSFLECSNSWSGSVRLL